MNLLSTVWPIHVHQSDEEAVGYPYLNNHWEIKTAILAPPRKTKKWYLSNNSTSITCNTLKISYNLVIIQKIKVFSL